MPTARTMSVPRESLETKPLAPQAAAALGEICPAPEIRSTRTPGRATCKRSQISAPDSEPTQSQVDLVLGRARDSLGAGVRRMRTRDPR
jgi:hypothetical protein